MSFLVLYVVGPTFYLSRSFWLVLPSHVYLIVLNKLNSSKFEIFANLMAKNSA